MYKVLNVAKYEELMKKHHITSLAAKVMANRNISFTNKIIENDSYKYKENVNFSEQNIIKLLVLF